jgi:NitT/TauT family transport system permease protein
MDKMLKINSIASYIKVFFVLLIVWQILSFILRLSFIPSPIAVFINIYNIFVSDIIIHALMSLWRVFAGTVLSMLLGVPLGLCMGYYKSWDKFLSPAVYFTYPIPKIALLPLVMLTFGLGEASKVIMIAMIIVFQVIVASRDAVKSIPKETFYSMYSLGAGNAAIFRRVILPASLPELLTSLRISLGTALSVLFFTETFGTQYGMGYFIMDSWMRINYTDMFSGIIVLSIIGLLLFAAIDILERILCPWN